MKWGREKKDSLSSSLSFSLYRALSVFSPQQFFMLGFRHLGFDSEADPILYFYLLFVSRFHNNCCDDDDDDDYNTNGS